MVVASNVIVKAYLDEILPFYNSDNIFSTCIRLYNVWNISNSIKTRIDNSDVAHVFQCRLCHSSTSKIVSKQCMLIGLHVVVLGYIIVCVVLVSVIQMFKHAVTI